MTIIFAIFVAILFYSYLFKLGYLRIATYSLFFLVLALILINIFNHKSYNFSKLFWILMFIIFSYALADKYFRIHIKLSKYLINVFGITPIITINILYVVFFIVVMAIFYKSLFREFKYNPDWIYLFIFALGLKVTAIFSDLIFHDITEDYFEVFSLYYFTASFLLAFINHRNKK